jgi:hypothetical protein
MIVATITALLLLFGGGGSLEQYLLDVKKPVKAHVEDKDRAKTVIALSKSLGKDLEKRNKEMVSIQGDFVTLHTSFEASEEDFQAVIDRLMTERNRGQEQILDTRDRMRRAMSADEWAAVFNPTDGP